MKIPARSIVHVDRRRRAHVEARRDEERLENVQREFSRVVTSSNSDFINGHTNSTVQDRDTSPPQRTRQPKLRSPKRRSDTSPKHLSYKTGTVKLYDSSKKIGYIIPDDGGADVCFTRKKVKQYAVFLSKFHGSSSVRVEFLEHRESRPTNRFAFIVRLSK